MSEPCHHQPSTEKQENDLKSHSRHCLGQSSNKQAGLKAQGQAQSRAQRQPGPWPRRTSSNPSPSHTALLEPRQQHSWCPGLGIRLGTGPVPPAFLALHLGDGRSWASQPPNHAPALRWRERQALSRRLRMVSLGYPQQGSLRAAGLLLGQLAPQKTSILRDLGEGARLLLG